MSMTWRSQMRRKDDGEKTDNEGDSENMRRLFSLPSLLILSMFTSVVFAIQTCHRYLHWLL